MFSLYKIRRSENSTSIILLWKILLSIGETFPSTNQFLLAEDVEQYQHQYSIIVKIKIITYYL